MALRSIQFVLVLTAIYSGAIANDLGDKFIQLETRGHKVYEWASTDTAGIEHVANSIATGFNGGAIGMSLICSICIVMIVWIEISKSKSIHEKN